MVNFLHDFAVHNPWGFAFCFTMAMLFLVAMVTDGIDFTRDRHK